MIYYESIFVPILCSIFPNTEANGQNTLLYFKIPFHTKVLDVLCARTTLTSEYENEGSNFVFDENMPLLENQFDYNDDSISVYGSREHFDLSKGNYCISKGKIRDSKLAMGYHYGRLQVLPVYYEFPSMTMKRLVKN